VFDAAPAILASFFLDQFHYQLKDEFKGRPITFQLWCIKAVLFLSLYQNVSTSEFGLPAAHNSSQELTYLSYTGGGQLLEATGCGSHRNEGQNTNVGHNPSRKRARRKNLPRLKKVKADRS
jgi:hypothetical protein